MAQYRQNRIAEEIKKNLDKIIREELNDPRLKSGTFSITRVEPTKDLRSAKVYISVLEEDKLEDMVKALKGAAGLLRHALGNMLTIRYTPELHFVGDRNIAYGLHIAGVLKQVLGDEEQRRNDEDNQPE
ncbi:MAG: 30S ribosome-binding factor RbfA [Clostridiales bacterium]|nr:30S ribosome-binding factor RbfA [Clostridiales bacterium]